MTDKISELKQCAENATQGEWWIDSHGHTLVAHTSEGTKTVFRTDDSMGPATRHPETGNLSHWPNDWDASYIAAANPSAILALIAENEDYQAGQDRYEDLCEDQRNEIRELKAEIKALRKAVSFAVQEFNTQSSADGSGHADIARAVLRIAGSAMSKEAGLQKAAESPESAENKGAEGGLHD